MKNTAPTVISYKLNKLSEKFIVKSMPNKIPSVFFCNNLNHRFLYPIYRHKLESFNIKRNLPIL